VKFLVLTSERRFFECGKKRKVLARRWKNFLEIRHALADALEFCRIAVHGWIQEHLFQILVFADESTHAITHIRSFLHNIAPEAAGEIMEEILDIVGFYRSEEAWDYGEMPAAFKL
jgi:hypothetical protein